MEHLEYLEKVAINTFLSVKDYSVSGEIFQLEYNAEHDLLKTNPQPPESELGKYYHSDDYISHTDSKRTSFERAYHLVRSVALKSKLNLINPWKKDNSTLLDIGAGTGDFLLEATKIGWETSGFEPSESARKIAIGKGVNLLYDLKNLPDSSFDVITMWHVLEHVPDVDAQISELQRLLKPDGILVVAVPNFKSHDAKIYGAFWAAYDVPRHLTHFSRQSIARLFANYQMDLIAYKPMWFDAFYVCLLSEKYRSGSMKPIKSLFNGLISNIKGCFSKEYSSHIYLIRHKR